jgi:hypothetical protein
MTVSRTSKSLIVILFLVVVLLPLSVVWAIPPVKTVYEHDVPAELIVDCGTFEILASSHYKETTTTYYDNEGNVKVVRAHWAITDGVLYSPQYPGIELPEGPDHVNWTIDPVTGNQRIAGMALHFNVPGYGIVALDAGTALLTETWEVIWERGPHMYFEGQMDVVCTFFEEYQAD